MDKAPFKPRDIIFCDECHNIPNIVRQNFAPTIRKSILYKHFKPIYEFARTSGLSLFALEDNVDFDIIKDFNTWEKFEEEYLSIYNLSLKEELSCDENFSCIYELFRLICNYIIPVIEYIESMISSIRLSENNLSGDHRALYKHCSFFRNYCCVLNDFCMAINTVGIKYIVKEINETKIEDTKDCKTKEYMSIFYCCKEDFLCWNYLLHKAKKQVLMSATVGGIEAFEENVGIHYSDIGESDYSRIPSTFDFSKSPIHFLNRYKMSYSEKKTSFPAVKSMSYKICNEQFPNEKGIIQTGSYANAKEIYESAPQEIKERMLLYNGSLEKSEIITFHKMSKNTILVGPTLAEGIDLPGDDCRFIIIIKVPYPVIKDEYVKRKIELFPLWYNSATSNIMIQGIGRGNRYKDDYCTTYIFDSCFWSLYNATKDQYPPELQERIKFYT